MRKINFLILLFFILLPLFLKAQTETDYVSFYQNNEFRKSYESAISKLNEIYSKRVEDKKIPSGYIAMSNVGEDTDLLALFRKRKEKGFFIEDNTELADLHFYAGKSGFKLGIKKDGLNHLVQSLRFRKLESKRDDAVYFEISQIFKTYNDPLFFKGYIDALETAYSLNTSNYSYSYEIGNALYTTRETKRAIFHLKRYLENTDEEIRPDVYLKLGNLYESIGKYLETEKYYNEYLRIKPDDGEILFALGFISYSRTGNYVLAESSLKWALKILKENDIYRRSKSFEYMGDMAFNNLKYEKAIGLYNQCITFQNVMLESIDEKKKERDETDQKISKLKTELINNKEFEKYEDYEIMVDERNRIDREIENLQFELNKLQPGRLRWYMAVSYEKLEKYEDAIKLYRESIKYDYNANGARDMIVKLQLKIKRGY